MKKRFVVVVDAKMNNKGMEDRERDIVLIVAGYCCC